MKIKALLATALLLSVNTLNGAWDPTCCISGEDSTSLADLHDQKYIDFKKKVFEYWDNRLYPKEKANLIIDLIFLTQPQICVEIGVQAGYSFLPIAATLSYLGHGRAYAIDAWSNHEAIKNLSKIDPNYKAWSILDMETTRNQFFEMLYTWSLMPYCRVLHATSENAAKNVPSIDFLHLDGNFSEVSSLLDVQLYLPKVRSGGYILMSQVFYVIDGNLTKMKALWALLDECELICEIENSNVILLRKN